MYHTTRVSRHTFIQFLDERLKETGLDYEVPVTVTLEFPDYPSELGTDHLPWLTFRFGDGPMQDLVPGPNSFTLPIGETKLTTIYDYFPTEGWEYSERTKRAKITIEFDENAADLSSVQTDSYEIIFNSPDKVSTTFSGTVTTSLQTVRAINTFTSEFNSIADEIGLTLDGAPIPVTVNGYLAKLLIREFTLPQALDDDEVIIPIYNQDWLEQGYDGDPAKIYGKDIPSWVRAEYPPFYMYSNLELDTPNNTSRLFDPMFNREDKFVGLQYWSGSLMKWVKLPTIMSQDYGAKLKVFDYAFANAANLTDIEFINRNLFDTSYGNNTKQVLAYNSYVIPKGTSRFRLAIFMDPTYLHQGSKTGVPFEPFGPYGKPYPLNRKGISTGIALYNPRFNAATYTKPRSLPMRSFQWFVIKDGEITNEVDSSLALPTYRTSDGRAIITSNAYGLLMTPTAVADPNL